MPLSGQRLLTITTALIACVALGCGTVPVSADSTPLPLQIPRDRPLRAGFLIVDGVYNTELTAPYDVFQHTSAHLGAGSGIEVFTVSPDGGEVTTAEGLRIVPHYSFETAPPIDILVVPSGEHSRDADRQNRDLIQWVSKTGAQAHFVVSLCWGAFILAEAGLLDGHSCTTFPGDYRPFAEAFPDLDLRINVTFVHDGRVLTSEGGAHSYDVAMYLVDLLFGEEVAKGIGQGLLIPWPPTGGVRPAYVTDPGMSLKRSTE
ncbi:MAG: DJ-1/PfpI family protein [Thermoanaerobaculia bacterium]